MDCYRVWFCEVEWSPETPGEYEEVQTVKGGEAECPYCGGWITQRYERMKTDHDLPWPEVPVQEGIYDPYQAPIRYGGYQKNWWKKKGPKILKGKTPPDGRAS